MSEEKETVVVSGGGGNSAGWFIAGIVVIALIIFGVLYANGTFSGGGSQDVQLTVEVPDEIIPDGNG